MEDVDHSKTKARYPQSNGICERFYRTVQDEFYAVAFRKKLYNSIEDLQKDLDQWIDSYNYERIKASIVLVKLRYKLFLTQRN
ncbi:integrase core domain protein [Leptospira sp. Fiocruz LV3954]|uniref:Integrase core domain protein n=1 Tax=Leptospira santarosai str. MOR084 TaxID=1049984 RepID=A0A0E2BCX8_9LEPT|nr:integrase core domain protein [Leptospira santarosai str. MOR084]EKO78064.1 integrase core domain protein [Leptospira sp. Fiocruz LV3954]EMI68182.1 integrase core domain protein [Leptospira sp. Fiocruz LV4135]